MYPTDGATDEIAIETIDLTKTYPKGVTALDGLSLSAVRGEVFGLLGPNGAGKSTTIKILTTLAEPDSGIARVGGLDVVEHVKAVRRLFGVVAQQSGSDPAATATENLSLQGHLYGLSGRELRQRVRELLDRFELADAAHRPVRTFSGGMRRRLDVALGLIHRPAVLFLDEPTTGLDPEARAAMWREVESFAAEGVTVLLTTHYLDEADRVADRVALIDDGKLVAAGTPDELKSGLSGDAIHIELPPGTGAVDLAAATLRSIPELGEISVDRRRLSARTGHGASVLPAALTALDRAGIDVASATVARPSLDDVYLRHTGHAYAEAGRKDAA
jgi:ABC-2 type transport system ATP-binding protein